LDKGDVVIEHLPPGLLHFQVDVVVGRRQQDACLLYARGYHRGQVLQGGPHPSSDLRAGQGATGGDGLPVGGSVGEELRLANHAGPQLGQQSIQVHDLLRGVGSTRLLSVAEGGIRDPDLGWQGHGNRVLLKAQWRDARVRKVVAAEIGLGPIEHEGIIDLS